MKKLIILSSLAATFAAGAMPKITDLSVVESGTHIVTISYKLADEPAVVTVDVQTNALPDGTGAWASIGGENITPSLSGKVNKYVENGNGANVINWLPNESWPGYRFDNKTAKVVLTAWPTNAPPTFMVVDLNDEANRFAYYPDKASVPGGITNRMYKTTKLLLRKIPAAGITWQMGSPTTEAQRADSEDLHNVTLTEDYYMAVYETTMKQYGIVHSYYDKHKAKSDPDWLWYYVDNYKNSGYDAATKEVCPYNTASYHKVRGYSDTLYNWPANGHNVASNAFMGVLRVMTGDKVLFDLPTDAQWEFAARAGTSSQAYFGVAYNGNWNPNTENLNANTWWHNNSDVAGDGSKRICHPVGEKTANAFDLYDVLGNVIEACLDQYQNHLGYDAAVDPEGPTTDTENPNRVMRGGAAGSAGSGTSTDHYSYWCIRSAWRSGMAQKDNPFWGELNHVYGFRIWAPATAVKQ